MIRKTITMDLEEYEELLDQIEKLKRFIADYYNLTTDKDKQMEIHRFMQKYGNWC